ncbi:hypothetical protein PIB30_100725 [Stylosanthes scabra]|uniref:Uncharacterized protein n=1 Tax=Stylosanthes scabra TaxID=79078 RepID=A0ABU6X0B5_9FABA|nr:hypothetical protein [Stylosanthes scabra]
MPSPSPISLPTTYAYSLHLPYYTHAYFPATHPHQSHFPPTPNNPARTNSHSLTANHFPPQHSFHSLLSLVLEDKHQFKFGVRDSVNLNQAFIMASSSSVSVFDNHRFKTAFNEELYNTIVKNKKVIAECCIDLDEDEYPEVRE